MSSEAGQDFDPWRFLTLRAATKSESEDASSPTMQIAFTAVWRCLQGPYQTGIAPVTKVLRFLAATQTEACGYQQNMMKESNWVS